MIKLAVIGTHGAGKSTLSFQLATYFKKNNRNVDIIQERIRFSPFPFNDRMTVQTALWGYHAQICRELESEARGFNVIICDRSAYDCFIYAQYWDKTSSELEICKLSAINWLKTYHQLYYIVPDFPLLEDGIRSSDSRFQEGINDIYLEFLSKTNFDVRYINTSQIFDPNFKVEEVI